LKNEVAVLILRVTTRFPAKRSQRDVVATKDPAQISDYSRGIWESRG